MVERVRRVVREVGRQEHDLVRRCRRVEAEAWCDRFEENNRKWLKSTVATWDGDRPQIEYEEVDTSIIPPRPRLYGLVGADAITEVWQARQRQREAHR